MVVSLCVRVMLYVCAIMRLCVFRCEMWYGMLLCLVCCFVLSLYVCVACDVECVVVRHVLLYFVVFVCAFLFNECGCVFALCFVCVMLYVLWFMLVCDCVGLGV